MGPRRMRHGKFCQRCDKTLPVGRSKFCSVACADTKDRCLVWPRICTICKRAFIARNPKHLTCSNWCTRRRANRNTDYHRWKNSQRRTMTRESDITPQQEAVMRKRARKCPLCGVWMTSKPLQPNSKELDHIIPRNMGGTHTHGNVRIICRLCNLKRPKDGSDYTGPVTLWAQAPGVVIKPEPAPKLRPERERRLLPVVTCGCGAEFPRHNPRQDRCRECLAEVGRQAAALRAEGVPWKEVAVLVGYRNIGNLHGLAVRHGGLRQSERNVRNVL